MLCQRFVPVPFFPSVKLPWQSESPLTSLSQLTISLKACPRGSIRSKTDGKKFKILSYSPRLLFHYTNKRVRGGGGGGYDKKPTHVSFTSELRSAIIYKENSNSPAKTKNSASSLPSVPLSDQYNSKMLLLTDLETKDVHELFK